MECSMTFEYSYTVDNGIHGADIPLASAYLWQFLKTELQTRRTQASYIAENPVPTLKRMFAFSHPSQS